VAKKIPAGLKAYQALKKKLAAHGLSTKGKKATLERRWKAHMASDAHPKRKRKPAAKKRKPAAKKRRSSKPKGHKSACGCVICLRLRGGGNPGHTKRRRSGSKTGQHSRSSSPFSGSSDYFPWDW